MPNHIRKPDEADRLIGLPGAIEASEAAGQRQFVASEVLPTKGLDHEKFTALGFKIGKVVEGDPMFTEVELPEGWTKEGSDHAMWSYVRDTEGKRRVACFYKAAYYDRDAFCYLENVK
jgi:hypothetical protein